MPSSASPQLTQHLSAILPRQATWLSSETRELDSTTKPREDAQPILALNSQPQTAETLPQADRPHLPDSRSRSSQKREKSVSSVKSARCHLRRRKLKKSPSLKRSQSPKSPSLNRSQSPKSPSRKRLSRKRLLSKKRQWLASQEENTNGTLLLSVEWLTRDSLPPRR